NPQIIYVGTSQRIYKSITGGGNWAATMNGIPVLTTFWDLLIDPSSNTIYAASQSGLFKSSDAGASWTQININNLTAVRSLAQDPNNSANIYAATTNGSFFRSLDGGTSWNQNNDGLTGNGLSAVVATSNSILLGGYSGTDGFIASLNSAGSALNRSSFFGGTLNDSAIGVRADDLGRITLVGATNSADFPLANAIQPVLGGGNDAFVARFNEGGASLAYSTFLGGGVNDSATSVAVDSGGNAYVAGNTASLNFPVQNPLQPNCSSCGSFINDAFVTKLNADGSVRIYSTFLGGSAAENATNIEVDSQNRAVVVGSTGSNNFPVLDAIQPAIASGSDGFIAQIKSDGSNFVYSTYYGGSGSETINGVTIAPEGNTIIAGQTTSSNFPLVRPIQTVYGGVQDAFIAKIGVASDLEIVITDERDPVMVNNSLIYNLLVRNNGPSPATGVILTDVLPSGVTFVSATPTQGTCQINGTALTCNLDVLAPNAQASVRLALTPAQPGTINNTATVRGNEPDTISSNNSDAEQTLISALPSIFGRIATGNGQPASNVNISVEGFQSRTAQTDAAGIYSVTELPLAGNYTVRPAKQGFYFSPRSRSFNSLTRDETADFVINSCSYTLSANTANVSAAGGNQSIFITANDQFCAWNAASNVPWISITSGDNGFGNGTVKISIQPSSVQRSGTLTIAGQTFTVSQGGCSFSLMPFQQSFSQTGGTGTIAVTASQSFCQWTAAASESWITVTGG
ncbi:MAG TPA: SBBP repeat-containing protein, partial [Pyrinomonadaceae bacterium]|nr:SBBP repeat-containing protein [Pyrinomonadaceae bacterium]